MAQGIRSLSLHELMVRKLKKAAFDSFLNIPQKYRWVARRMSILVAQYHVVSDYCSDPHGRDKDICSILSSFDFVVRFLRTEHEIGHDVSDISDEELWEWVIPNIIRRTLSEELLRQINATLADPHIAIFLTTKNIPPVSHGVRRHV